MVREFKPGDRVRHMPTGRTATVGPRGLYTDFGDETCLDIIWDQPEPPVDLATYNMDGGYYPPSFEHVAPQERK